MSDDVLAVIPARSGSKGLPDKNIKELSGKPLLAWTIKQAKASEKIDQFVLSTDSEEYAEIGEHYGAPVPFIRPEEYAEDDSPTSDVLVHAIDFYRDRGREFETIALLEPTSPLRKPDDIDRAIERFEDRDDAEALVSIGEVHLEHPHITKTVDDEGFVSALVDHDDDIHRRQQLPDAYFPYGVIYISNSEAYRREETFYQTTSISFEIERWQNYEIDDIYDFLCIERIIDHVGDSVGGYR